MTMSNRTAYSYSPSHHLHTQVGHPENENRLARIIEHLRKSGILDTLHEVPSEQAAEDVLLLVHSERHVTSVRELAQCGGGMHDADTYSTESSDTVALESAGSLLRLTEAIARNEADNGFALIRPPGHHAERDRIMGFCLFNNIALAARWARREFQIERIAIIDFDVHHGNGTQDIFYEDRDTLFISSHQFPFYPGTGSLPETGSGSGEGTTVNLPLPAGTDDDALISAYHRVVAPLIMRFGPQFIFVSAGYDAHHLDPLGGFNLTEAGFAEILNTILECADFTCAGKVALALEGGYHPAALVNCVHATLQILSEPGSSTEAPSHVSPGSSPDITPIISDLRDLHGLR